MSLDLSKLYDGQRVRARWGRAGPEDAAWGPWTEVELSVQRGKKDFILSLKGVEWAEYTSRDYDAHFDSFLCEDYYLQIETPKVEAEDVDRLVQALEGAGLGRRTVRTAPDTSTPLTSKRKPIRFDK